MSKKLKINNSKPTSNNTTTSEENASTDSENSVSPQMSSPATNKPARQMPDTTHESKQPQSPTKTPQNSTPLDPQLEIELIFKPKCLSTHPELSNTLNKERYIKTKAFATIDHLAKYLSDRIALESTKPPKNTANRKETKINIESNGKYCIHIKSMRSTKEFIELEGKQNLSEIYSKYWYSKKPLELYYSKE